MALIVPDAVPSKASSGEKRVFKILRDELPDDCLVWYEPNVKGLYPDFIILSPTLGLLILEVKGWSAKQILRASDQFFEIQQDDGKRESQQSPLRQAKSYQDALIQKLKGYSILTQDDGDYQGKLAFPVGVGAILTNITEAQARDENIYPLLEKPQAVYRDELLDWDGIGERTLLKRLSDMFTVRFKFMALADDQISTIKGIIHPEVSIRTEPAKPTSVPKGIVLKPDATIIKTLDIKQEQLARSINSGHRLFCGVAGSGKTLILLSRAKALAHELFPKRILILCFNVTLAAYLRSLIEDDNNPLYQERITVIHFHEWAKSILGGLPNPRLFEDGDYDAEIGDRLLVALEELPLEQRWDAIFVDEAHTFAPSWFRCCVAALKSPEDGDLMIVSDGSQSLYQRQQFSWKSVGIKAQGRTRKLNQNYRNTQEILSAAWNVVQSVSAQDDIDEDDVAFPIVEPRAALRTGQRPLLHLAANRQAEVESAIAQIQQLLTKGYESKDIAIIYRYKARHEEEPFHVLTQQLEQLGMGCYWVTQDKREYSNRRPGVRIITAKSSLGLEFKAVLILWVQQFGVGNEAEGRRELYVSMTRAQEELHLFGSGQFLVLKELQSGNSFDVVEEYLKPDCVELSA
ncbi:DNA helicase (plasmid) [Planktothrix tepida]|uniref:DNA helicase II n=1 Tax=Planktothrix tepida PCC 9214 TaxID=671072 RepID=A0A1J1LVP2_9CYAN|nr:nuclease-related domain-containing DEAD/DEAH box helicase [Planktothrix tepida]CAD5988608.1 DNA helicase [Planktothrix tepida]CUR36202.1 DNA helicase II [Planktothrix tepida PCC 9214]